LNRGATFWKQRSFVVRVGVRLTFALVVALFPWPELPTLFGGLASTLMNALTTPFLSAGTTLSLRPEGPTDSWNAVLTVGGADGVYQELLWNLRRTPYLPMAAFTALVVAIPFGSFVKRVLVLGAGLAALQVLPLLRLLVLVGSDTPVRLVELSPFVQGALLMAVRAIVLPPGMAYVVPLLLWVGLMALVDRAALLSGVRRLVATTGETLPSSTAVSVTPESHVGRGRGTRRKKIRSGRQRRGKKR
jgi:hypothetical protein